ncbi:PREDICTED: dehydrogenase/reductase SDR family member on chromosome X, partial [Apaloderma vittatum]|uniref:dehydrogenase/reductase SDR family member on chromosome X n=1 Tax=Apaloderma vittatum TaxID=57397 RepID=UPI000521947A
MNSSAQFSLHKYLGASSKKQTENHLGHLKTTQCFTGKICHLIKISYLILDLIHACPKQLKFNAFALLWCDNGSLHLGGMRWATRSFQESSHSGWRPPCPGHPTYFLAYSVVKGLAEDTRNVCHGSKHPLVTRFGEYAQGGLRVARVKECLLGQRWHWGGGGVGVAAGTLASVGEDVGCMEKAVFPNGKVAIVTGGAKGIGYQTVKHLARLGMHVIIAGNSERDGQEAVRKIQEETLTGKVEFLYCDLASMKSIRQFVQRFKAKNCPLHVLVNNAGVMLVPEKKTEDGFEEHFGLNYLGHFLLTNLLLDTLKQSGTHSHNARIITVSSATHYVGKLHLNDLQSRCSYSPHGAYAQSKLALVLFTYRLQHLLTANGSHVTANVVDPGVVNTELYKHVFWVVKLAKWMTAWLFFK